MKTREIAAVVLVSAFAAFLLLNRKGNQQHHAEAAPPQSSEAAGAATSTATSPDQNRNAQREHHELMRLRDEVSRLHTEKLGSTHDAVREPESQPSANLEQILETLRDPDPSEEAGTRRFKAAEKLRTVGVAAGSLLPQLQELLQSGNQETAYAGAAALAFISEANPEAFSSLTNALLDPNPTTRDAATHGAGLLCNHEFRDIGAEAVIPSLVQNLQDASQTVRADTIGTLDTFVRFQLESGKPAPAPDMIIPALTARLTDEYQYARLNAATALGAYGQQAKPAVGELQKLLNDPAPLVRSAAEGALRAILPASEVSR